MCVANETLRLSRKATERLASGLDKCRQHREDDCGLIIRIDGNEIGIKGGAELRRMFFDGLTIRVRKGTVDYFAE